MTMERQRDFPEPKDDRRDMENRPDRLSDDDPPDPDQSSRPALASRPALGLFIGGAIGCMLWAIIIAIGVTAWAMIQS